jgi:hypothetical protein
MRRALQRLENVLVSEGLLAVDTLDSKVALPQLGTGTHTAYPAVHRALQQAGCGTSTAVTVKAARHALPSRQ